MTQKKTITFKLEVPAGVPEAWLERLELDAEDALNDAAKELAEGYYEDHSAHLKGKQGPREYLEHIVVWEALKAVEVVEGVVN
jgi:hypothetical protein